MGSRAVAGFEIDQANLLAGQLVDPAFLLADEPDEGRRLAPVAGRKIEHVREPAAVGGRAHAVAHRQERDLIHARLGNELVGHAGGQGTVGDRIAGLQPLVALHPLVRLVSELALLGLDLHTLDAAVARIEHVEIVGESVGEGNSVYRVGAGAIRRLGDEDGVLGARRKRARGKHQGGGRCGGQSPSESLRFHGRFLLFGLHFFGRRSSVVCIGGLFDVHVSTAPTCRLHAGKSLRSARRHYGIVGSPPWSSWS